MKERKNTNILLLAAVPTIFFYQIAVSILGGKVANLFSYVKFDPDNVFAWISVHHIIGLLFGLLAIACFSFILKLDFRFRVGNYKKGLRYVAIFIPFILSYHILSFIIGDIFHLIKPIHYSLNAHNMTGYLGFQLFLSGTEEFMFRALPITVFAYLLGNRRTIRIRRIILPIDIIVTALLFSLAHINWYLNPFRLEYDIFQLVFAFALGIVQGITYIKTNSILYPILMHSISNVIAVSTSYIYAFYFLPH